MKIKIKIIDKSLPLISVMKKGDWIDLYTREDISLKAPQAGVRYQKDNQKFRDVCFDIALVGLNVCIELPSGYEALVAPRSSTFNKFGIFQTNHIGIIDGSYCGDNDEWKMSILATRKTMIPKGTRLCQFRIQLSQFATFWQKLRWLFWNGKIEFVEVDSLNNEQRGSSMTNNTTNK